MTTIEDIKNFLGEDADLFDFMVENDAILVKNKKFIQREKFIEIKNALYNEFKGRWEGYNTGFVIPLGESEEKDLESASGTITEVYTTEDGKWVHIMLEGERVPLALEPKRATDDLKPGAYFDGRVSVGQQWCFIREFKVVKGISKAAATPTSTVPPGEVEGLGRAVTPAETTPKDPEAAAPVSTEEPATSPPIGLPRQEPAAEFRRASETLPPRPETTTTAAPPPEPSPTTGMPTSAPTPIPTEPEKEEAEYLKDTWIALGPLDPIKLDAHGNIIDGYHRRALDPDWPTLTLKQIVDPAQLAMSRLVINICRRKVPAEEKMKLLGDIAKLTGWSPQQIAKATGMSERWVLLYLPKDLKGEEPEELTRARLARRAEKGPEPRRFMVPGMQWGAKWVTCSNCKLVTREPFDWKGKPVCHVCYEKFTAPPPPSPEEEEPTEECPTPPTETSIETPIEKPAKGKTPSIDVGIIECAECHAKLLLVHKSPNQHELKPVSEPIKEGPA